MRGDAVDAIAGLLDGPHAREAFLLRASMDPPWSLRVVDEAPLTIVAMVRGEAWVLPDGGAPELLRDGDVALMRGPDPYTMADDPATEPQVEILPGQVCRSLVDGSLLEDSWRLGVRSWGNAADGAAVMLVGTYQLDGEVSRRLLRALPALLAMREGEWDSPVVSLLSAEIVRDEPGQEAVLDRLLDLLVITVLRDWFARPDADGAHWYRAYGDPVVGRAMRLLQHNPAHAVDRRGAGARVRDLTGGAGAALPGARRRAPDRVPHELADRARGRPAARAGRDDRLRRRAGRLRDAVRAQHCVQAPPRDQPAGASRCRLETGPPATDLDAYRSVAGADCPVQPGSCHRNPGLPAGPCHWATADAPPASSEPWAART